MILVASCGGNGSKEDAGSSGPATLPDADGSPTLDSETPDRGGDLRVGLVGGSARDSLDPMNAAISHPDSARSIALYDTLMQFDHDYNLVPALAEEMTYNDDATVWTVRLREGLEFSDGSPITADDVIFTVDRLWSDANTTGVIPESLKILDRDGMVAEDELTAVFPFTSPIVNFNEVMAHYSRGIVPVGFDPENPVSSGPFMVKSFTPGEQSTFVANPNYWQPELPYLDELTIINFEDDASRVNALLGGQVDVIEQVPLGQVAVIEGRDDLDVVESETGGWLPFTMRADQPPFDDVRVRQAFRLIVDREQMVNQVLGGHARVGNDVFGPVDTCDVTEGLPQREQDIEAAKALLAEAGMSGMEVELVTTPAAAGLTEAAQVFAQQAKEAGVTVNIRQVDPGTFYGDQYLKWTFAQNYYYTRSYLSQATTLNTLDSPLSETHLNDPDVDALLRKANGTVDPDERCKILQEAAKKDYDEGAYIIWGFPNNIDAFKKNVRGLVPDRGGIPLSGYSFDAVWIEH